VVALSDGFGPFPHEGDDQGIGFAQILQERGDAVPPQVQAGKQDADPARLIILVEPAAGHPRVAHPQQGDHIDAHGIGSGVDGVQLPKQRPRHQVHQDDFGIVLELNLPRGDGVAAGDESTLYDVAHRVAVHRYVAVTHPFAAHTLHHGILERTVSAFDDDGVPRSLDCSDLFRDCHMKTRPL